MRTRLDRQAESYARVKGMVGMFLWVSAGWAALETLGALKSFEGRDRLLAVLPLAWFVGAVACALAWRKAEAPSGALWAVAGALILLALAETLWRAT